MPNERVTTIILGDSLDRRIGEALSLIQKRDSEMEWTREQMIRLIVGYGLDQSFDKLGK